MANLSAHIWSGQGVGASGGSASSVGRWEAGLQLWGDGDRASDRVERLPMAYQSPIGIRLGSGSSRWVAGSGVCNGAVSLEAPGPHDRRAYAL